MRIGLRILKSLGKWKWRLLLIYSLLVIASDIERWRTHIDPVETNVSQVLVPAIKDDKPSAQAIRLAYKQYGSDNAPVVVLLQGSPGNYHDFRKLGPELATHYRVIAPDLPGFGSSSHRIPYYSNRAHARYVLELLDQLHVQHAHVVGFSMGGGVALQMADIAPERVSSLTSLSGIGVQELELLGNYYLNHSIHGAQLAAILFLREGTPHFGWFDSSMLDLSYARNFYDTDQRPLRSIMQQYAGPMLIIHGEQDMMVPVQVALEDYRLVPQSEMVLYPEENHFYVFRGPDRQAQALLEFFALVDRGKAQTRATADPQRVALSKNPFNPAGSIPRAMGPTALLVFVLLALATLISEDLTCVWAGVMAAEGRIGFAFAAIACLFGIFVGDVLLFLAGRLIGRAVLRHAPVKWFFGAADVARSSAWFQRRGMRVIALSRFIPGTRLPTYFAAGLLNTSLIVFSLYFFIAAAVWTPLLVGASMLLGREVIESSMMQHNLLLRLAVIALLIFIVVRVLLRMMTFRGRRMLLARWRRLRQWEFWPPWMFYPPVVFYICWLALKYRALTLFTCANPAIEEGGFIGESKSKILSALGDANRSVALWGLIERQCEAGRPLRGAPTESSRIQLAREFMIERGLTFPVVLKPDMGERGEGVAVIRSEAALKDYLRKSTGNDVIIQQHIPGLEFGVFYYRYPDDERGRILAITKKLFPAVTGDGSSTIERLILLDDRAVCMARAYLDALGDRAWTIPATGEVVQLIEIGTHCRGSIFLDGTNLKTEALEETIDHLSKGFAGFYFGRFDLRVPSLADFQLGRNLKVVELNGVTSEATSIHDPKNSLLQAYSILCRQWRIAFEIGAQNRQRGAKPASVFRLARLLFEKFRRDGERSGPDRRPINGEADMVSQLASDA